ncbi:zinc-binding dehydrogenase [Peribacillus sp. NPDC058002]|uniref:zinc-dependent alcohol dehydrogenase n=1 Tax=Peribacillus sp. NPDC058002 TaxID=3346301 RepID=UPI0036DEAA2A
MLEKMKAAMFIEPGKIEVQQVNIPEISDDEVLIKVKYCGICGTDMHIYNGVYSKDKFPLIAGHEFSGVIEKIGGKVKRFKGGEKVIADINLSCNICYYCRHDQPLMCNEMRQIGIHINGAFAEYVVVPHDKVYVLPETMDFKDAALLEPISCVVRAAKKHNLKFAESVAIIGDGAIALMHVQMAKICGAAPIIVIGLDDDKMKKAKELGADYIIKSDEDMYKKVQEVTYGRGADLVIESVGLKITNEQAFKLVRPGGRIMPFGIADENCIVGLKPSDMVLRELTLISTVAGVKNDIAEALTLVEYKKFKLDDYLTNVIPLDKITDAFKELKTDRSIFKVLIKID